MSDFSGFPPATFEFLRGVAANNDKAWFDANRDLYERGYVAPAMAFVEAVGPKLRKFSPEVQFVPKVNSSIIRINRDIRFSNDKRPYKDHLDLWFWHGDKRGWDCPGFYFRLTPKTVWIGGGMHMMPKEILARYRDEVIDERSGKALERAIAEVEKAGVKLGAPTRKQVPRGYPSDHKRSHLLLIEGLHGGVELPGEAAKAANFADITVGQFKACWPILRWMLDEIA